MKSNAVTIDAIANASGVDSLAGPTAAPCPRHPAPSHQRC
jgi:hypothetical protein